MSLAYTVTYRSNDSISVPSLNTLYFLPYFLLPTSPQTAAFIMSESSPIDLIPQPPVWASVRSIKNISTLTEAEKELLRVCAITYWCCLIAEYFVNGHALYQEKLVECSLPLDKSWSRQNPEDIQQFLKRVGVEDVRFQDSNDRLR